MASPAVFIAMGSLADKVVIVTGASSGIGAAIAIKFAAEGANVAIVGRNEQKLKNTAEKCEQSGSKPMTIVADVTKDSDVKRILNDTIKHFGKLDVLVNNAGISGNMSILSENAMEFFDHMWATNLRAAVYMTNLAAPHLVASKGNIINISSIAALVTMAPEFFAYCSSKAALDHFTRCVALELSKHGVRVNTINPGPVRTDIVNNSGRAIPDDIWETMKKSTALDRVSEPEETAELALFLASDKARSITGSSYVTDNGCMLKGVIMNLDIYET